MDEPGRQKQTKKFEQKVAKETKGIGIGVAACIG